jgi:hypothetical protein
VLVAATLGEAATVAAGVAVIDGGAVADEETDALGLDRGVLEGRNLGEAEAAGVALAAAVDGVGLAAAIVGEAATVAAGVVVIDGGAVADEETDALGLDRGVLEGRTVGEAEPAGVALAPPVAGGALGATIVGEAATVAAGVVDDVAVSTGFTNFFGGAFGGGVASVLNLVRTRSAAERSLISVQPLSTFTSTTRSLTRRGLKMFRTVLSTGTETSSSSPRTLACVSEFRSRRKR